MRTLLVLTKQASLAAAIEAVLDPGKFQIIVKETVPETEMLLARGAIDVTVVDTDLTDARAIRTIETLKSFAPGCPTIVYAGNKQWEWEEDAYIVGVANVLDKPVRGKLLTTLLDRIFPPAETRASTQLAIQPPLELGRRLTFDQLRALEALRRFSSILTHSLDCTALLKQFLLLLREIVGVNRAIIFLRKPSTVVSQSPLAAEDRWLRSACAIGLDQSVLQHFALSLGGGIGAHLHRQGRILRASSSEAQASRDVLKEFQLLGAQVAIPILDRQSLLGVAVLDERLTGEPYANEELALIFHMLEEVGLGIRNSWLHDQVIASHAMIADILGHLGTGCVVVGNNLDTLHANVAAVGLFAHDRPEKTSLEFADLPQELGSKVFTVIKTGVPVGSFKYRFPHRADMIYRITIVPFRAQSAMPSSAGLLLIEDVTEHERAQQLETEASNLRLVKSMAEHLAHEIGNAIVPLSTHQQLFKESINDQEFQESLAGALTSGVKRISRLANQMVFLARDWKVELGEAVQLSDLIVEAFHEAHTFHPGKKVAQLTFNKNVGPWKISGDPKALRHAFSEIILNALQANPEDPNVAVNIEESKPGSESILSVEVRDSGAGFTAETARRAQEPFFSTRSVGLGIGLTVTRKIIESHKGRIDISTSQTGESGVVRVSLPLAS